jgi:hypothetical protein
MGGEGQGETRWRTNPLPVRRDRRKNLPAPIGFGQTRSNSILPRW